MSELSDRVQVLEAEAFRARTRVATLAEQDMSLVGKGLAELLRQVAGLNLDNEGLRQQIVELGKRFDWLETKAAEHTKLLERIVARLEA